MAPPPGRMPSTEPIAVPRRTGATIALKSSRVGNRPLTLAISTRACRLALEVAQDFGDAEDADRDRDEVQPIGIFADAEGEARRAGIDVGADEAEQQAERHHGQRLDDRAVRKRDRGDEADDHQREIFGRAELQRDAGQRRREDRDQEGRDGAGEERAEGGDRKCRAGPALARHLVAVDGGDGGGGFAGHVDQDRRGRAAILRAVVDAGEHDQRGDRLELEGDRQQHGDGRRGADAGQHADQRAEQHADEAEAGGFRASRRSRSRARDC